MQKYYVHPDSMWKSTDGNHMPMYLADEADARIAELERASVTHAGLLGEAQQRVLDLERALKSADAVIAKHLAFMALHAPVAREAKSEADRVLTVNL
jgi:hypothetical protein